jgi:hypothetical protein
MGEITALNGAVLKSEGKKATLTLEYELQSGKLSIGGEMGNLDLALNILEQAKRYLEGQQRFQQMRMFQAQIAQDERVQNMLVKTH